MFRQNSLEFKDGWDIGGHADRCIDIGKLWCHVLHHFCPQHLWRILIWISTNLASAHSQWIRQSMELSSRRRWRLVSVQVVSCCVYKTPKQSGQCMKDNNQFFYRGRYTFRCWAPWSVSSTLRPQFKSWDASMLWNSTKEILFETRAIFSYLTISRPQGPIM